MADCKVYWIISYKRFSALALLIPKVAVCRFQVGNKGAPIHSAMFDSLPGL